jgi:hypothetical protein
MPRARSAPNVVARTLAGAAPSPPQVAPARCFAETVDALRLESRAPSTLRGRDRSVDREAGGHWQCPLFHALQT